MTETQHLRDQVVQLTVRVNTLETASMQAVNDCTTYIKLINDYQSHSAGFKELQDQIVLQLESIKLPLTRSLK